MVQLVIAIAAEVVFALVALASSIFFFALDAELLFVLFVLFSGLSRIANSPIGLVLFLILSLVSTEDRRISFVWVGNDLSSLENEIPVRFRVSS